MNYIKLLLIIIKAALCIACIIVLNWTSLLTRKSNKSKKKKQKKDSLTIFLISNNYKPYSGGVATALDSYAQELRAKGHKVIIITLDFLGDAQEKEENVVRIWSPIRFIYRNNHMAIPWRPTKALYDLAQLHEPDILHVFHPFLLGVSGLKVGIKLNLPVAFTYMTLYDQYAHYIPLPKCITQPIINYIVDDFCEKVDVLIAPSNSARDHIIKQGVQHKTYILPLSILPEYLKDTFTPKPAQKSEPFMLLFVSRFTPEKNIFFLLDMFKKLDQTHYRFTLIGFGSQTEALEKYAYETLALSPDIITFIIQPPKEEICAWYDTADLFIFASKSDTQGLVLAEAMARGTPVVALEAPGVVDIVKQGINGFMVNSQAEMIEIIEKISHDKDLFESLQKEAWITGNHYSASECTTKLLTIYHDMLNTNSM